MNMAASRVSVELTIISSLLFRAIPTALSLKMWTLQFHAFLLSAVLFLLHELTEKKANKTKHDLR